MFARCVCVFPMILLVGCETSDVAAVGSLVNGLANQSNDYNRQPQEYYRPPAYSPPNGGYYPNQAPVQATQATQAPMQAVQAEGGLCYDTQSVNPTLPQSAQSPLAARAQYCGPSQ